MNSTSLEILFEDNHLIIVNKKSGEIVQGDKTGDPTLAEKIKKYIKKKYNKKGNVFLGIIHRLDRPTSGIIVYAKTSKALSRMNDLFRNNKIKKKYWAIIENKPPQDQGKLENYLLKNQKQNKSYVVEKNKGKLAILSYELIKKLKNYNLVEINLQTGRHHQIRTQLSNIKCFIKGDVKYGARRSNKDMSISLHARTMQFIHPVKKEEVIVTAKTPNSDKIWTDI